MRACHITPRKGPSWNADIILAWNLNNFKGIQKIKVHDVLYEEEISCGIIEKMCQTVMTKLVRA